MFSNFILLYLKQIDLVILLHFSEIIKEVRKTYYPPYRPSLTSYNQTSDADPRMMKIMVDCWDEIPSLRPDTNNIKKSLIALNKGR